MREFSFSIEPRPPFRLDLTVWVLKRRPDNIVDRWDGATYRRLLMVDGRPVDVAVRQEGTADAPRLCVLARGPDVSTGDQPVIDAAVRRMLGTDVDLTGLYALAERDPRFGTLVQRFRGVKPTRYPTVFEGLVNAIACQQITLTFGLRILARLADAYGPALRLDGEEVRAFPGPVELVAVDPEALRNLGFSRQKARAVLELSEGLVSGDLRLDALETLPDAEALARLIDLRGVGRWTAEYVLLRSLGRWHIFPGDDVGGRNNLQRWLKLDTTLDYAGVQETLDAWRDYGGLVYFHLLLARLEEAGYVQA